MYVKATNGTVDQFPYTIGQLRRDNPSTSFPSSIPESTLESWGVFSVTINQAPDHDPRTHKIIQDELPTLSNGNWSIGWDVLAKTKDEIADDAAIQEELIRSDRDSKLKESDFYALSDVTMSAEMSAYRKALRDITDHEKFPWLEEQDWPVKP